MGLLLLCWLGAGPAQAAGKKTVIQLKVGEVQAVAVRGFTAVQSQDPSVASVKLVGGKVVFNAKRRGKTTVTYTFSTLNRPSKGSWTVVVK
ncbi:MAG TPA: hypothetical protein PK668_16415 [Myxococcota bacterium]|nr:hypothetical protein [Myxococcota bacterium]HRY94477.1 hypothetical protein [Myxococcota bacterium]